MVIFGVWEMRLPLSVYKGDTLRYIISFFLEKWINLYQKHATSIFFCLRTLSSLQVFFFLRYVAFKTQNRGVVINSTQLELNRNAFRNIN